MDVGAVVEGAQQALSNSHAGRKWARDFVSGMSPKDLKWAVETGFDPVAAIIAEYSLGDSSVRPLAKMIVRRYWKDISSELKSVPAIIKRLQKNPANREQLAKPETINYLNLNCQRAYHIFYDFAWPPNVSLRCAYCKAVFPYDVFGVRFMDFEARSKRLRIVVCPACGRDTQAVF